MKILFAQAFIPIRITYGGELRTRRFVQFLKTKGDLDLLTLELVKDTMDTEYIRQHFQKHHALDALGKQINKLLKLRHMLPTQLAQLYNEETQKAVNQIVEENNYDLIFVSKLYPAAYFLNLPAKWHSRIIMDFDDILSDLYKNYYKDFFTSLKNSYSLKFYEQRSLQKFRRLFICSKEAFAKVDSRFHDKVGIVPNVYEVDQKRFMPLGTDPNHLLFVGSLDYFPNIDGLKWFLQSTWAKAKQQFKDLKLTVIGKTWRDAAYVKGQLGEWPDVEVFVNVDSVVPYYQKCFATIVPLLDGSGTRVKILESASFGRPVLTTVKGMEGLQFADKKEIFLFKDSETFMDGYQQLRADGVCARVAADAFKVLREKYSPQNFEMQMGANWEHIIKGNGKGNG